MSKLVRLFTSLLFLFLLPARYAGGYSLLTHEQLIDLTWEASIVPLLKSRYPTLTDAQLEHARAYAYGGCVIQDIGYYPFGDSFFSDLTHYVRSGDFVVNLFRNAGNADELAFAVGALSHYIGDSVGHADSTNLAVPVEFPKLGQRYGRSVNYAEGKSQHIRTEFAFDINEISRGRFAPVHYLRHVGLEVPQRQLELAFYQTYGLAEDFSAGKGRRVNVRGYRFAVRNFIPRIAYAVTLLHRHSEPPVVDSPDLQRLASELSTVASKNHWDLYRRRAGIGTYSLAGVLYVLPRIGPLKLAAVKGPHADTDRDYIHSVLRSTDALNFTVRRFTPPPATRLSAAKAAAKDVNSQPPPTDPLPAKLGAGQTVPRGSSDPRHPLRNRDLDTGSVVRPGGYPLTDATYCRLVHRLAANPAQPVPPGIKADILAYYADRDVNFATKTHPAAWKTLQADLATLQTIPTNNEPLPYPTYGSDEGDPSGDATY
ncbi:zinc dependent phospholipase C family protein [Edaphobacter modestus]|uniref:Zinc dependent phospholipase C n=1 Tax=Edaphobacter modestus TaxID=388466 RepID=A0A4Q7YY12_9BACT|nr:zinc dependent phospholipase C family protein [Edaphobacter modestus]RZU42354.1 zinc dependent phospholipase C [Edaphobacter modestus]